MALITQRSNKLLIRLTFAAVLFAQGVIAAHACMLPVMSSVQVFAKQLGSSKQPCNPLVKPALDQNPMVQQPAAQTHGNACLASCAQADQINSDNKSFTVVAIGRANFLSQTISVQSYSAIFFPNYQVLNTGPPVAIRFCTFLI